MGFVLRVHLYSALSHDWAIGVEKELSKDTELVAGTWMNSADKHQLFSSKQKRGKDTLAPEKCWKRPLKPFENAVWPFHQSPAK